MLRGAQADIEVICEPFPFAAGITLSCGAVDLNATVDVAHAEAQFAIERPVWRLDLAVTDIAGRLADGAPEAGAIDRVRLTDASVGHGSTDLGAHVAGLLEAEVLRLMADRARREGNAARAAAVLATALEASGETPRYRLTGTLRPLDGERMRLEVRLAHEDRTLLAAGADIAVSSLPPRLVEGQAGAGGTTPVAGRMYEAVAVAVVSGRLDRDSAAARCPQSRARSRGLAGARSPASAGHGSEDGGGCGRGPRGVARCGAAGGRALSARCAPRGRFQPGGTCGRATRGAGGAAGQPHPPGGERAPRPRGLQGDGAHRDRDSERGEGLSRRVCLGRGQPGRSGSIPRRIRCL